MVRSTSASSTPHPSSPGTRLVWKSGDPEGGGPRPECPFLGSPHPTGIPVGSQIGTLETKDDLVISVTTTVSSVPSFSAVLISSLVLAGSVPFLLVKTSHWASTTLVSPQEDPFSTDEGAAAVMWPRVRGPRPLSSVRVH